MQSTNQTLRLPFAYEFQNILPIDLYNAFSQIVNSRDESRHLGVKANSIKLTLNFFFQWLVHLANKFVKSLDLRVATKT